MEGLTLICVAAFAISFFGHGLFYYLCETFMFNRMHKS